MTTQVSISVNILWSLNARYAHVTSDVRLSRQTPTRLVSLDAKGVLRRARCFISSIFASFDDHELGRVISAATIEPQMAIRRGTT